MRPPIGSRSWIRAAAAILGLVAVPVLIALGESLPPGSPRSFCFAAAAAAAIAAVALIAESLEVRVDLRESEPSRRTRSRRSAAAGRGHAGSA